MPSARPFVRRRSRAAARWTLVVAAVTLSVAGCVSMPDGGPPLPLEATQSGTAQNQDYTVLYADPPGPGEGPKDIVQGFLLASLRYSDPAQQQVARSYLTTSASNNWHPQGGAVTVFSSTSGPIAVAAPKNAKQTTVTVSGQVVATLNGNGQQVLSVAQGQTQPSGSDACDGSVSATGYACEQFTLAKDDGQWRIQDLPANLLIDEPDFVQVYQSQDVYFFDPKLGRLVPDTVFVPLGTSVTSLLTALVKTLITGPGPTTWVGANDATVSALLPSTTARVSVESGSTTAVVYLSGAVTADSLSDVAAQLVWTLAGPSGAQYSITAVELVVNGTPWEPNGSGAQTPAAYAKYNPYPAPASFTYIDDSGAAQSQCGSVNDLGLPVPVFATADQPKITSCSVASPSPAPAAQPTGSAKPGHAPTRPTMKPLSMLAVSPVVSGISYVAGVSHGRNQVSIWQVGEHGGPIDTWPGTDITSISWDRQGNLWITMPSGVWVLSSASWRPFQVQDHFDGTVNALSIAPDGVRVAAIVNGELELAAIARNTSAGQGKSFTPEFLIGKAVPLGPSVTAAAAVTWYDTDDLMVVAGPVASRTVEEVPVNGRAATPLTNFPTPPAGAYAESIAADTSANVLIVGLSNGQLEYYDSFNGSWRPISGSAPAYSPNP